MAFTGSGSGTTLYPYEITTRSEFNEMSNYGSSVYFKIMNDIDFEDNPIKIESFTSHLNGQNFWINNVEQDSSSQGFYLENFCSIENFKIKFSGSYEYSLLFNYTTALLSGATIQNIHITCFDQARMSNIIHRPLDESCIFKDIIVEGNLLRCFSSTSSSNKATYENIKVLRTNDITSSVANQISLFDTIYGNIYRCQHILLGDVFFGGNSGLFANSIKDDAVIEQCLIRFNNVTGTTSTGYFNIFTYTSGYRVIFRDSYAIGNTFDVSQNNGGYVYNKYPNAQDEISRFYFSGNIIRRNNLDDGIMVYNSSTYTGRIDYSYYQSDLLTGFTPNDTTDSQEGLNESEFSGTTNFSTWNVDANSASTWVMSGVTIGSETYTMPTLRYNPEYTDFIYYSLPTVSVSNVQDYPYGNRWLDPTVCS